MYAASASPSSSTTLVTTAAAAGSSSQTTTTAATASERRSCQDSKDALCRRMGALFLRHRVEQLTDDVDKLTAQATASTGRGAGKCKQSWSAGCPVQRQMQRRRGGRRPVREEDLGHAGASDEVHSDDSAGASGSGLESEMPKPVPSPAAGNGHATRIIVADASLLIYSLRTVHDWLKAGDCRVVIPCEALRTLDVLKKGEHFLNLAARRATRFLDERFTAPDGWDESHGIGLAPGLFPQASAQRENLHSDEVRAKLVSLGADPQAIDSAPLHVQKTMSCFVHFALHRNAAAQSGRAVPTCSIAVALPPPHLDYDDARTTADGHEEAALRYAERADGNVVIQCVNSSGLTNKEEALTAKLIIAPTAASWLTAQPLSDVGDVKGRGGGHHVHHMHQHHHHHHQPHHLGHPQHAHRLHHHQVRHANVRQC